MRPPIADYYWLLNPSLIKTSHHFIYSNIFNDYKKLIKNDQTCVSSGFIYHGNQYIWIYFTVKKTKTKTDQHLNIGAEYKTILGVPWCSSCYRPSIVTAVAQVTVVSWVLSLDWELLNAVGMAKKKKKKKKTLIKNRTKLHDIGFGNDFLDMTPKGQGTNVNIDKRNYIKI